VKKLVTFIKRYYDRLIALIVVAGLLGTLTYLAFKIATIEQEQRKFDNAMSSMTPKHEKMGKIDTGEYEKAVKKIQSPFQITWQTWSNYLFIPEDRVMCVDCRKPIPFSVEECPFCNFHQPLDKEEQEDYDGDGDGVWDSWEREHRLDPRDPSDAEKDFDGDGFSNFAEFSADPRTDPRDASSYPPPEAELRLVKIMADPFKLRFKGSTLMPDGTLKFQINLRGNIRTFFAKLGEEVEGFKVEKYEPNIVTTRVGQVAQKIDKSILTLKRGDKAIPLERNVDVAYSEYIAHLKFALDGTEWKRKIGEKIALKGKEYEVISIDFRQEKVIIRRMSDGKEIEIRKFPAGEKKTTSIDSNETLAVSENKDEINKENQGNDAFPK